MTTQKWSTASSHPPQGSLLHGLNPRFQTTPPSPPTLSEAGFTIALQNIFWEKHLVKANIALAKGKNVRDKRRTIKERDIKRETARELKKY